jgi:hypothetical protein
MIVDDRPVEPTQELVKPTPGRRKFRVRLFIFLVCLAISGSMWVFIELMKDYTTDIVYSITFKNVPEDLILINQADSSITVGVTAQGFELLVAQYLQKRQPIELDLSDLHIRQGSDSYVAFMPSTRLIEQVSRQLSYSKSITYVRPDTLLFKFSEVYKKRVPVKLDLNYSFSNQYQLFDSVRFNPQYIIVSSIKDVIDTIRFVSTQHLELNDLDSNITVEVPLHKALRNNMIRYSDDSISIKLQVQKYTEAVFSVPVTVTGNVLPIRIYPDQVEVSCLVPLSSYKEVEGSSFTASVIASPTMLTANKHLQVILTKMPPNVRLVRLKPDHVEYIIIAK